MSKKNILAVLWVVSFMMIPIGEIKAAESGDEIIVQPCNELTGFTTGNLVISSSGMATVGAKVVSSASNTNKVFLHVYLQQYKDGAWQTYKYWVTSSQSTSCTLTQSIAVDKGYSYRVKVSSWVMANGNSEQVVKYTNSQWY